MKLTKLLAGSAALTLASASLVVGFGATSAQAYGPTAASLPGSLFLVNNTAAGPNSTSNNTFAETLTLTATPAAPAVSGTVTVTLSGTTGAKTGPVPVAANTQVVRAIVKLSGAQAGSVNLASGASCNYPAAPVATSTPEGPWSTTGTYTATSAAVTTIALNQILFDDKGNGEGGADGNTNNLCAGSGVNTNADYYVSSVTQTTGSLQPGLAKTAPVTSATINTTVGTGVPTVTATPTDTPTPTPTPTATPTTSSPAATSTPTSTPNVDTSPRTAKTTVAVVHCQTYSKIANDAYKNWPVAITVSPGAAAPGSTVAVAVSLNGSPNNGPAVILDPGSYRFEASIQFDGAAHQLIGPTNKTSVPMNKPIFTAAELPTVAKGTVTLPSTVGTFPISVNKFVYNNLPIPGHAGTVGITDIFDSYCDASATPITAPKAFVAPVVFVDGNASAPSASASSNPSGTSGSGSGSGSGGALAATGPRQTLILGLLALLVLQVGAVFAVRAHRAAPRKMRHF